MGKPCAAHALEAWRLPAACCVLAVAAAVVALATVLEDVRAAAAILSAATIGLVGILPLLALSMGVKLTEDEDTGAPGPVLRTLLGFACGGLLANAFLHILPEAHYLPSLPGAGLLPRHHSHDTAVGLWTVAGIVIFFGLEKLVAGAERLHSDNPEISATAPAATTPARSGTAQHRRSSLSPRPPLHGAGAAGSLPSLALRSSSPKPPTTTPTVSGDEPRARRRAAGILNLVLNVLDNFMHGLAIAAAFKISLRVGFFSTTAIVVHEIPHEVGDFAILLRSGFAVHEAVLGQLGTSLGGVAGAAFGLFVENIGGSTVWILPLTAGGFVYIALVSLTPDLLAPHPGWHWARDVMHIVLGAVLVGTTACWEDLPV